MTRTEEEITRDKRIDLKVLVEYIKNDLFPKAKFVLGNEEWDVGGTIYKDYMKCCKGRIGLQTMTDSNRENYMKNIWMTALNKKLQNKALVRKRSAIYTVMQNKFTGNYRSQDMVWEKRRLNLTQCCCSSSRSARRHVQSLCGQQVCFAFDGESQETMGGPEGPLHFLHVLLYCCHRRRALEGMSLDRRHADWQQHHGGICPPGFGEQLIQGVAL
jgi:hypothetical protein